jgi:hypothetical protein
MQELCGWDNLRALKNAASPGKNPSEGKRSLSKQGHFLTSGVHMGTAIRSLVALLCFSSSVWVTAQNVTAQDRPQPAIIPLDQIHEGMKGTALTVFQGVKPESMDVEVLGVMHNVNGPKGDIILVRLHGTKPEYTGVVAGMSGSPVYFDGKLAGALAFRIGEFSKEPIAGVTPIEEMLEINALDHRPAPRAPMLRPPILQPILRTRAEPRKLQAPAKALRSRLKTTATI